MQVVTFLTLITILTSCASNFDNYRQTNDYNVMMCQKMCSTGDVANVEKFGCACRFNRSDSKNLNYSSSNGNVTNIYSSPQPQNSPSNPFLGVIMNNLMSHEENRLNRLNRDLNSPNPNIVPQYNNYNYNYVPNNSDRAPTSFGGFGGF